MRTVHLVVSGSAFAVWTAASVVYFVAFENANAKYWYLIDPAAVMPAFWCVYAWFASRRAKPSATGWLTLLAMPVMVMGLGVLSTVTAEALREPDGTITWTGIGVMGGCGWELSLPFGLTSFIWGIVLQVNRLRQPPAEP